MAGPLAGVKRSRGDRTGTSEYDPKRSFLDRSRTGALAVPGDRFGDAARAFDEALDQWTEGSVLQRHERDRPGPDGQVDGQRL